MYSIPENDIAVVHNFLDFNKLFKLHPLTTELVDYFNLLEADTICIYPTRITESKQIHKLIKLFEQLKLHQKVRLIICNSWSNGETEKALIKKLQASSHLLDHELIFTSQFESQWCKDNKFEIELGIPKEVVIDLMRLSDLFILPSISECCSMIMLEAAASKTLTVLNSDLWSLYEFGGQKLHGNTSLNTMYLEFGSSTRPILNYLPSEEQWYQENAKAILDYQRSNQAINFFKFVRKRHNPKWIYENEILPLLT
jgi:hypothetical protein